MVQFPAMDAPFFIGLVLAIPLSIMANLLTPKTVELFARRSRPSGLRRIKSLDDQIAWFDMIENNWSAMYSLMISDAWASVFQGLLIMMAGCILLAYAFADAFEHLSITGGIVAVRKSPLFQWGLVPFAYAGCMFFKSLFIVMSASSRSE